MTISFGRFELDEEARRLRLDQEEQALQPLVFDLLVYLVRNHNRVVPKEELLSALWAGTTVTDGSLQRAVSLLRAVLREGDQADAVQTFARRGYRFCASLPEATPSNAQAAEPTIEALALADAKRWDRALAMFETVTEPGALSAEELETWANAAMCSGKPEQAVAPLERAVAAFERRNERESAARVAVMLANLKLEGRELAIAKGWHERARTYLRDEPECKQHGMAEWIACRLAMFDGRLEDCLAHARAAGEIAQRVDDSDLHCLGLIYQGHILIAQGQARQGLAMHDEAGAFALAGRVSPWTSGIVFCSVIWGYLHLGDHHRAGQWTDEFSRWCERHRGYAYPALCRLHRGEVLAARGELEIAQVEVSHARERLAVIGPYAEGDACRVLGEIHLFRGDLDAAESEFRQSHQLGWNPQPGLGLMLAGRGQTTAAIKQLEAALRQPGWTDGQRRGTILAVLARIAAMAGELERARAALVELDAAAEISTSNACRAEQARARAELCWAEGAVTPAETFLRQAVALWLEIGARVHAAHVRLRLCELLLEASDPTAAELELASAEAVFREVEAVPLLARCKALRAQVE